MFMVPAQASVFGTKSAEVNGEKTLRSIETGGHARTPSEVPLLTEPPLAPMPYSVPPISTMAPARLIQGSVSLSSLRPSRSEQSIYPLLSSSASSDELMQAHDPFGAYAPVSIIPPRSIPRSSSRTTLGF
ncbi:hypothetical protein [Phaffia rhodozyma]|uniref:Uncharacterized protein n=1 Tax=Phaffia rhodozyma TaxID=264483 RepID=A0A0F7SEQ5_PHARH|nr:hypothetical protein [Phaffia rhodozyma]